MNSMNSSSRIRRRWTDKEDHVLSQEAASQLSHGALKDWNRVAAKLPGRTNKDCRKRWSKIGEDVKKGAWDTNEDEVLRQAVQRYGSNWTQVALAIHTRNADQCAKRWQYSLDPSLDHSEWKSEDDDRLLAAVDLCGRNWKTIKDREFPGRSTTDIKNRHGIVLRRRRIGSGAAEARGVSGITPDRSDQGSLLQETEDEDDSSSASGNPMIFDCGEKPVAVAPVAPMGFGNPENFAEFDQEPMADTLKPFELDVRHDQNASRAGFPMSGINLEDSFLNQTVTDASNPFYTNYSWNVDAVGLLNTSDVASSSVSALTTSQSAQEGGDSCTVLTMYNVESRTLNSILETAFNSKTKIKMETHHGG